MKNFKAVSIDCNQEQFESMKQELIELGCVFSEFITIEGSGALVNNFDSIDKTIGFTLVSLMKNYNRTYIGGFDKEAFLKACGKIEEDKSGWYIHKENIYPKWLSYFDFDKNSRFGFDAAGGWYGDATTIYFDENLIKATNEQVLRRLTEEAEKRGYKDGVRVLDRNGVDIVVNGVISIGLNNGSIYFGGATIMNNGIWADIVPDEIEFVEPEAKSCGLANEIISNGKEQEKKLDSAIKSRNQYKYLYEKEKAKRLALELVNKRRNKLIIDSNPVSDVSTKIHQDIIKAYQDDEKFQIDKIERLKNEVECLNVELSENKEANKELYAIGCKFGSENDNLKKEIKSYKIMLLAVSVTTLIYVISNFV